MSDNLCSPDCPVCGGLAWVRSDAPVGNPDFGKLKPCPKAKKSLLPAFRKSGLTTVELELNWSDLLSVNNASEVKGSVQKVFERKFGMVYLWGSYGLSKSLILKTAVATWLRQFERGAVYSSMSYVLEKLRHSYDDQKPDNLDTVMGMWDPEMVPMLAIDEFDKVRSTEFGVEQRFLLFDKRYELACQKSAITLMASNLPPDGFDGYISDRLKDARVEVVEVVGKSVRSGMDYDN